MTDFDFENREKKIIAGSARHKRSGRNSRRCSLPSDLLTESQKRKLNGPLVSVKMGQPMHWSEFKLLNDDLKREYLASLNPAWHPNLSMLSEMFGVSATPVSCETKKIGWEPDTEAPRRRSPQMKKDWWNFCHREQAGEKAEEECKMMSLKNEEPRASAPEYDPINHPKHYCREGGMECLEEMELVFGANAVRTFCLLNAWKYRYRAADKNGAQDMAKSDWYMQKYRELSPRKEPYD